ncbi:hypothetical protein, partial [Chitinophaga parva]|uniref:hypothetical protein n=1 Tax=Chitinophaga parva TaxID=2169414 RepID=UPI00196ABDEC
AFLRLENAYNLALREFALFHNSSLLKVALLYFYVLPFTGKLSLSFGVNFVSLIKTLNIFIF